jgi:hypothetical protein
MSESLTRCVIVDNMEESHRRGAAPVVNKKVSRRRDAAPATSMRQRACRDGMLVVKA